MKKRTIGILIFLLAIKFCVAQVTDTTKTGTFKVTKQYGESESIDDRLIELDGYTFSSIEKKPEFPGGEFALMQFLAANTKYPQIEKENGISGTVYISFVIERDGTVSNTKIVRGIAGGGSLNVEALRVVGMMPNWKPGMQDGKEVRVRYILPIKFVAK